jgi:adenine-specific DNA-methyltransferase
MTQNNPLQSIQTPDLLQEQFARLKAEFPDLFTNEGQLNPAELLRLTGQSGREHFDFQWWGKSAAKRKAFAPTTAALRYDEARSVNPEIAGGNAIIEGENLEVLKLLLCAYRGQVKCIYIDPPYNTGNDFVYKDNFKEGERAYWEQTGVTQDGVKMSTNTKADGRYHSNWLNMIYPRLLVARQLLREDGVIFVSIDDNEVTHLRKVMDEVFGEGNFVAQILWKKRSTPPNDKVIGANHDYITCYAKSSENVVLNLRERGEKQLARFQNPDNHPKGNWAPGDLMANVKGGRFVESLYFPIKNPATGEEHYPGTPESKSNWRFNKERIAHLLAADEIYFGEDSTGRPKLKRFLSEVKVGMTFPTIGDFVPLNTRGTTEMEGLFSNGRIFDNPKPVGLLTEIFRLGASNDSLIVDFFGGSGSSVQAALELNTEDGGMRKVISVQIPEATDENSEAHKAGFKKISDITIERVKRVIQGYGDNPQPIDAGFKVFTLEKSAFPRANFAPDPDANEAVQLAALKAFIADKEASLFNTLDAQGVRDEVLLKCGFQLDVQLTPIAEVTANPLYRARDQQTPPREAIVCFDSQLDTTTLEWLGQQKGQRVIVLEAALDTTGKWNLHHQLGDGLVVF